MSLHEDRGAFVVRWREGTRQRSKRFEGCWRYPLVVVVAAGASLGVGSAGAEVRSSARSGGKIAYATSANFAVIRGVSADGRTDRLLVPRDGDLAQPAWAPDGKRLAYYRFALDTLMVTAPRRGRAKEIDRRSGSAFCIDWAPTGQWISYLSEDPRDESRVVLHIIRPNGSGKRKLPLLGDTGSVDCPTWSPNGRRLAYTRVDTRRTRFDEPEYPRTIVVARGVWTVDARTRKSRKLFDLSGEAGGAVWSPNGRWFALSRDSGLHIVRPNGTGGRRVTRRKTASEPTWSPDSKEIAFGTSSGIYKIRIDGTGLRLLTRKGHSPDWGPGTLPR